MRGLKPKITLEDYWGFFENVERPDLTIDQLNQIVFMHGFIKLHRHVKKHIVNTLDSLDLMSPTRSTVRDNTTSSCAVLTVDEVKQDIQAIGWQECPVGSIATLGSTVVEEPVPISSSTMAQKKTRRRSRGKKRKRISTMSS